MNIYDKIKDNTIETEIDWKYSEDHQITSGFQIKSIDFDLGLRFEIDTQDTSFSYIPLVGAKTRLFLHRVRGGARLRAAAGGARS